jgi:hypothetical protein
MLNKLGSIYNEGSKHSMLSMCMFKQVSAALRAAAPKDAATTGALEGQLRLVDTWIRVHYK